MVKDNRRIAPPSICLPPSNFETPKVLSLVTEDGLRLDGRKFDDLRQITLKLGVAPSVTGSAYLEWGKTKIIASINGPRDVLHKSDSLSKGQLFCEFKYAMFSCKQRQPYLPTDEEMSISKAIQEALEPVVLLHKFPKARLDISIIVLENDGSVISSSIICAGAALSNAGVEIYDLPVSCTLVNIGEHILIDPTAAEEGYRKSLEYAKITLGMMPAYNSQVIFMDSIGSLKPSLLSQSLKTLRVHCQTILSLMKDLLKWHLKKSNEQTDDEDTDQLEESDHLKAFNELKLFQPQKYMNAFLENNSRLDGRELNEFRSVLINVGAVGTAYGSALVRLHNTSVLCGIKADLTNPSAEEPNKGFIVPNVTLTPICSSKFQPGPPTEHAQALSRIIMDLIENSDFVDLTSLCVAENKLSWCLFVDMVCLSHDGNILDACVLGMMAALKNLKLPKITVSMEEEKIEITDGFAPVKVNYFILPATFALLEKGAVADPSEEEESLANGTLTVFVKSDNSVLLQSFGVVKEENIFSCIKCAKARYVEMKRILDSLN